MLVTNSVEDIVARYARNKHREEFVKANPDIPEEVLAVVYFRRTTNGKWWYAPADRQEEMVWYRCAPLDAKWYEIPVCPIKTSKIKKETRERYMDMLLTVGRINQI